MSEMKIVVFTCDRCGKTRTLVGYHPKFGWYCRDCLALVRDHMVDVVRQMDIKAEEFNTAMGVEAPTQNNQ